MTDDSRPFSGPPAPLEPQALRWRCDPASLEPAAVAAEQSPADVTFAQDRALAALRFGARMRAPGYNLFVLGHSGTRRHQITQQFLEAESARLPPSADWCYLNNFADERKPSAVQLPAGRGAALRRDMARLIDELLSAIPAAFESEQFRTSLAEINQEFEERHRAAIEGLQAEAKAHSVSLVPTPHGFALAPLSNGRLLKDEDFERLPAPEQRQLADAMEQVSAKLREHLEDLPRWQKEHRERLQALHRHVTEQAAAQAIRQLELAYGEFPQVLRYLQAVHEDVLEHARDFLPADGDGAPLPGMAPGRRLSRYEVNLLVDHSANGRASVVYEHNPSVRNLLGRTEHVAQFGALLTDFTMIRPGALHRANGGYLILDADRVLLEPFAWSALKRVLFSREIRIESLGELVSLVSTVSLEPEPIPLDAKVVLVGERSIYYLLCALDPDFAELFKVAADFEDRIDRTPDNTRRYARLVDSLAQSEGLRPLSRQAAASVIERAARLLGDSSKLTTRLRDITDLLHEADYWAADAASGSIEAKHISQAIDSQTRRLDRMRAEIQDEVARRTILIDTDGSTIGRVNGLSYLELGGFAFGRPVRITASVRVGAGEIVDIERETDLGGAIHSKGVLILTAYLSARYAIRRPLSIAASLVFEQSYGGVEGDSASVAETCALLSAIADVPIDQGLAVTGSINQHGEVQAIGGVNEKVEGFFDVCRARGLTGRQGVLIPRDNVKHLMLREDVVEAAARGRFAVYPIGHVDEAIGLLAGLPAGEADAAGAFPQGSVNRRVEERLRDFAEARRAFGERLRRAPRDGQSPRTLDSEP